MIDVLGLTLVRRGERLRLNEEAEISRRRDGPVRPGPGGHRRRLGRLRLRRLPPEDPGGAPVHPHNVGSGDDPGVRHKQGARPPRRRPVGVQPRPGAGAHRLLHGHMDLAEALHYAGVLGLHGGERPCLAGHVPYRHKAVCTRKGGKLKGK